ncbi:MAG: glycerol-3-phosphate dehydrogenase/oxidase [Planctomycetota bacterium]
MRSDPSELHGQTFDLLVIGGGIQGAAIAREAAMRSLGTMLVESRDFATGTSSRSSRLVHGGLRYLQQGHLALVREALHERERLLRLCPHLVRPVPMLLPFHRDGGGSRLLAWLGVRAYSWLAGDSTVPRPRKLDPAAAVAAFPGLRTQGLLGAVLYFDAATVDSRLTLANVQAAATAGARVVNHCEVLGLAEDGAVRLLDHVAGREVRVRARRVVNAAGPRADAVRRRFGLDGDDLVRVSRGSHLVLDARPGETALAAFLPDRRIQFVVPHPDGTICGTTDVDESITETEPTVPEDDVRYLMSALAFLLAPAPRPADVRFAYCGWRSLPAQKGPPGALNREAFLVQEALPGAELFTAVGGKLTTHRAFAERALAQMFDFDPQESPTRAVPLPGGDGPREVQDPLWWRHGSEALSLRELIRFEPAWGRPLCPHRPLLAAEAVHALRHLGAVTFADLMLRRLIHAQGPCLRRECLRAAHGLFLRERSWPVDDDFEAAAQALEAEVHHLTGGLLAAAAAAEAT